MDILKHNFCLVLNSSWNIIGYTTIQKAIKALFPKNDSDIPASALDLEYELDEKGFIDFTKPSKMVPVDADIWCDLPIRDFDIPIHTSKKTIRAPIVIISNSCSKPVFKKLKPTRRNLWEFYNHKCIWTGKVISYNECTKEHMIPRSHSGKDTWANLAPASKHINHERQNIPLEKWKYKPAYKLIEPKSTPVSAFITKAVRPEWQVFLLSK